MADMLVKLYNLPSQEAWINQVNRQGITIRKPIGPEKYAVIAWVQEHFGLGWAAESECAYFRDPRSIYIAVRKSSDNQPIILGFACYDATTKGFFGPIGVHNQERANGVGAALLMACMNDMKREGYGYCVIGDAGPTDFFRKICGATEIEDSNPGIYADMLG